MPHNNHRQYWNMFIRYKRLKQNVKQRCNKTRTEDNTSNLWGRSNCYIIFDEILIMLEYDLISWRTVTPIYTLVYSFYRVIRWMLKHCSMSSRLGVFTCQLTLPSLALQSLNAQQPHAAKRWQSSWPLPVHHNASSQAFAGRKQVHGGHDVMSSSTTFSLGGFFDDSIVSRCSAIFNVMSSIRRHVPVPCFSSRWWRHWFWRGSTAVMAFFLNYLQFGSICCIQLIHKAAASFGARCFKHALTVG